VTSFLDDVEIMVTGAAIVVAVLALLWGLTALIGVGVRCAGRIANGSKTRPEANTPESGIPPHHLVVIAAVAAETIQAPHRIVRISAPAHRAPGWTGQGRLRPAAGGWASGGWPGYRRADRGPLSNRVDEP
jgi:Na+-transporting methylmalonyl-CoA/oxaloacetate decarboxylase gamma subunit